MTPPASKIPPNPPLKKGGETTQVENLCHQVPQKMLPEWQREMALGRAALVRLYLQEAGLRPRGERAAAQQHFIEDYNFGLSYPELFGQLGQVSYGTLQRWAQLMRETADPLALAPHWGEHRKGASKLDPAAAHIMVSVALHPHNLPLNHVVKQARRIMVRRGVDDGHSDGTYLRFLKDYRDRHYRQWIFHREGQKALNDKCLPYLVRDYDLIKVGDAAVADGHKLNFEILNPWTGKPQRMILLLFFDLKSRMPLGWEIMPTENTQSIAVALRRAILRLGMPPLCVYIDNGKAFRAEFFSGTPDLSQGGLGGLFHRLEREVIYAWPYHGQSKPIERFFGVLAEMERLMPSYIGTCIEAKPAHLKRGEKLAARVHQKMTGGFVPTIPQAHAAIARFFDEYAQETKKRGYLKGTSPLAVFEAHRLETCATRKEMDPEELRELMMPAEVRTIRRNGIYLPHTGEEYYHPALSDRRHPVVIRYDWQQPEYILVYETSGEFICKAEPRPRVHPLARITGTAADRKLLAQEIALKKGLEKETISAAREFAEAVIIPETREFLESQGLNPPQPPFIKGGSNILRLPDLAAVEIEVKEAQVRQAAAAAVESQGFWQRLREAPDQERYEELLQLEVAGRDLPGEELAFMRYFEQTEAYRLLRDYFEDRRLLLALGNGRSSQ